MARPSRRAFYEELHRVADGSRGKVRRAFLEIVAQLKSRVSKSKLREAVQTGDVDRILSVIDVPSTMENRADAFLANLRAVFEQAAAVSLAQLPKRVRTSIHFDLLNPESVSFLRNYRFDLISPVSVNRLGQNVGVTKSTIDGIRQVITDAFEHGGHPHVQARYIQEHIGLNARQARALGNHWSMLFEEGVSLPRIGKRVDALYSRMLRQRATNIARTETIRASSAGQEEVWRQARAQGLLDRDATRVGWVVTPDDKLCPICRAIPKDNPNGVKLGEPFKTQVGPVLYSPAHPRCRCSRAIIKF